MPAHIEGGVVKKWSGADKAVVIPEGVTEIAEDAFLGCSSLESVYIPEGVTKIGLRAFKDCSSLESIVIPEGVTEISVWAFTSCSSLESVRIPEGVTRIGASAFRNCSSLESVRIPEGVTRIGASAFRNCSSLAIVEIPEGVTEIYVSAFEGCSSLESVYIPEGVTEIGGSAFEGCSSLESAYISEGVTKIGLRSFIGCSSLESVYIPEGVTEIDDSAFEGCSSLESIYIPESVVKIGRSAFEGCSSLESVCIPEGVTEIDVSAFSGCSSLKSVVIYGREITIGPSAFGGCFALARIQASSDAIAAFEGSFRYEKALKRRIPNPEFLPLEIPSDPFTALVAKANERKVEVASANLTTLSQDEVKSHLEAIVAAERDVRFLEEHLRFLYARERILKRKVCAASLGWLRLDRARAEELKQRIAEHKSAEESVLTLQTSELLVLLPANRRESLPAEPAQPNLDGIKLTAERPAEPEYAKAGLFGRAKVEKENAALKRAYEEALAVYEAEVTRVDGLRAAAIAEYDRSRAEFERAIALRRQEIEEWVFAHLRKLREDAEEELGKVEARIEMLERGQSDALAFVRQEIAAAEESAVRAMVARKAFYSLGIVHPKYANFVTVCTLYDYLDTGRCTELAGPNGAYNLYESELRANTIIDKLDSIEDKLDDLRSTQYSAYTALASISSELSSANSKMDAAVRELSRISESSAAAAYHAEAAARYAETNAKIAAAPSFGIIW